MAGRSTKPAGARGGPGAWEWLASLGVGRLPLAPGTWGSALTAGVAYAGLTAAGGRLAGPGYWLGLAVLTLGGLAVCNRVLARGGFGGGQDPGPVVVDEAAGQLLALAGLAPGDGWWWFLAGFGLFRLFDILKPWPIRWLERLPRGYGIMADDLAAGLLAALVLRLGRWLAAGGLA